MDKFSVFDRVADCRQLMQEMSKNTEENRRMYENVED